MGIFSTTAEVIKNKDNFKHWEEKQRLEQAQREKLYQTKQYSEEELAKAKALGKNIIGAIDVMDNHSESVAENVETATEPLVGIAPTLGAFLGGWASFKFLINPASKKIDDIQRAELNTDAAKELYRKIQESIGNERNGFSLVSKRQIKKIKDPALKKQAEKFYQNLSKKTSIYRKSYWLAGAAIIGSLLVSFMGSIIGATKLQVNSSKVARFQARRQLEDTKYFVNYTPEQIAQAQADMEEAKEHEKQQKKGLFKKKNKENNGKPKLRQGFWGSLFGLLRDIKAYRKAKKQDIDESKIVTRELTAEELIQAEKDKEVIQRTVRLINNEAEKNSENMETAANVLIGGTPFLGAVVGGLTSWILNKTGIIDKAINKSIEKNASEATKKHLADYRKVTANKNLKGVTGLLKKLEPYFEYVGSMIDDLEMKQPIENGIRRKVKPSDYFKRYATAIMTSAKGRNWIFGLIGGFMTGIAGLVIGLKLQKSAARAGRYTAKRDLEKDPRNFIGYTQEEYNEVQDVQPVRKESRFKDVVLFIPRVLKQYFEYSKYKKQEFKEQEEFKKYLHKQEVTQEQIKEAKNLQRKVFNTFEKVDDNSQKYSESMEAAIDIAKPFVAFGGYLTALTPIVLAIVGLVRAKENSAKIIEKVTGWMKNGSKITNSKLTKKYLEGVSRNVSAKTAEITVDHRPFAHILQGVNLQKDAKFDILRKVFKNLKLSPEELRKLPEREIDNQLKKAYWALKDIKIKDTQVIKDIGIDKYLKTILDMPTNLKIDALDMILNPKNIKNISKENYDAILKMFASKLEKPKAIFKDLVEQVPIQELRKFVDEIKNIKELKDFIGESSLEELTQLITRLENPQNVADDIINKATSQETITKLISKLNEVSSKLKELPDELKNNKEIQAYIQKEIELPAEFLIVLRKLSKTAGDPTSLNKTLAEIELLIKNPSQTKHKVKTTIKGMLDEGVVSVNKLKNIGLKECIAKLKSMAEKSTPEDLEKLISNLPYLKNIKGLDKETLLKILDNLEKSIDNIPKAELKKIMNSMIEEFNKNPDEFVKLVTSGRLTEIFLTPELQSILAIAGVSIPTLSIVITYAISSWLANLELRAGRLGVMKSLEELDDVRYYANADFEAV